MRTLLTRGLVEEAGTDHETGAHLYRTTSYFLERIGVDVARRAARAGAVPPRHGGRARGRASGSRRAPPAPGDRPSRGRAPNPTAEPSPRDLETDDDGLIRLQKLLAQSGVASPAQVRGADARRAGRGRRRGRHPARHQGRPAHRGDPGRRAAAAAGLGARLPRAQQAPRRGLDDVGPARAGARCRTWSPTGPSGSSTSAGSTPTPPG